MTVTFADKQPTTHVLSAGKVMIACDLDEVFLLGQPQERLRLYQLIARLPNIELVFMTDRGQESVMPLLDDPTLPKPTYLICDSGATVNDADNLPMVAIQTSIEAHWPGEHVVSEALKDFAGIRRQEVPQRNRCAFLCEPEAVTMELIACIEALGCSYKFSQQQLLEVLPKGVSKSRSLAMLVKHIKLDPAHVLFATNSLTQESHDNLGDAMHIVITNNENLTLLCPPSHQANFLNARKNGCGAILEALAHFGFLSEKTRGAMTPEPTIQGSANLVMVYHRLPYEESVQNGVTVRRRPKSPNGIIPTLLSFFRSGIEGSWVAWAINEQPSHAFEVHTAVDTVNFPNLTAARVPLTSEQVDIFYKRFSKEAFWPVLHTFWERASFNEAHWQVFLEVNKAFAEASAREAAPGATVWLHDYNLWMVPAYLRALRPDLHIAFFHHTHFPSSDIFNVLPWRRQIIASLLQCDYIGFHIPRQVENFVDVVRGMAPIEVLESVSCAPRFQTYGCAVGIEKMSTVIRVNDRIVGLGAHPVGLDMGRIRQATTSAVYRETKQALDEQYNGTRIILSVERLDFTKGILQKLLAYESLLEKSPALHEKIKLIAICVPAASGMNIYDDLLSQIEQVAGRINGRFSKVGWQPLNFFFRSYAFEEVAAFYAKAQIMWITPLCDGLNLVGLEYAAVQGMTGGNGVLVLSEFAGASAVLKDALLTNPNDPQDLQDKLLQALAMRPEEAESRMTNMNATIQYYNLQKWGDDFLAAVHNIRELQAQHALIQHA
jgi:glucosylglycerol-phosphate synthase